MVWRILLIVLAAAWGCEAPSGSEDAPKTSATAGGEKAKAAPKPKAQAQAPKKVKPKPPSFELIAEGKEPRQTLRYNFNEKFKASYLFTLQMEMGLQAGQQKLPTQALPQVNAEIALEAQEITAEGNLRYTYTITSASIVEDENQDPEALAQLQEGIKELEGISGTAIVTPRGTMLKNTVSEAETISPATKSVLDNLNNNLRQLSVPFPEEPVGVGAQWKVTRPVSMGGLIVDQEVVYTLEKLKNGKGSLSAKLDHSAPPQEMPLVQPQKGVSARLKKLDSDGTVAAQFDLDKLSTSSKAEIATDVNYVLIQNGNAQPMGMNMKVELSIEDTKPKARKGKAGKNKAQTKAKSKAKS